MESKKINQLATELAPDLSDLTIIGDPTTGISKKITLSQMASLFTGTVEEYANLAAFPITGVADTIYIALDTNVIYRWDSTSYVVLSPNVIASLVFSDANGFDGTISLVGSVATLTITTALTSGSVPFIGASGALTQDNSNLFFDDTNNRLGIATASPTTALDVFGSGIIGRLNATSTNNSFLGFASNGTNKWSVGNVQSDHRFRIFSEANSAELITILQTGEFGIGIANPTTKFHIDGAASALIANLDANVSIAKSVSYRSDNSARINLEVSGTESGSNVGADFFLRTFTDAGSLLETPFTIVRSTGVTTIKSLTLTNVLSVANGGTGLTTLTSNYLYKGNGTSALAQSIIYDNGTKILIGSTTADFGILDITTSNAVGFTSALGIGFRTNVAEGDSVGISFKTKISLSGTIWENARIATITESITTSVNGALAFYTMNATVLGEKMRITPSGNVGINTISPNAALDIAVDGSVLNYPRIYDKRTQAINQGGKLSLGGYSDNLTTITSFGQIFGAKTNATSGNTQGYLSFLTNNGSGLVQALRLAAAGDATFSASVSATAFEGTSSNVAGAKTLIQGENTNTGTTGKIRAFLQNGVSNLFIEKYGTGFTSSGIATTAGGAIYDDGVGGLSVGATNGSGTLRLFAGGSEYIRINSGGVVCVNATAPNGGERFNVQYDRTSQQGVCINNTSNTAPSNTTFIDFRYFGTSYGSISGNGTTTSYNVTSDYRLKEDFKEIKGIEKINAIKVYDFVFKGTEERMDGVIAHELQDIVPYAVVGEKDGESMQGVDYSKLVPILIKAVQELKEEIDLLKAK